MTEKNQITVADICDAIGRGLIAATLEVRKSAVSNAVSENRFPSKWYLVIKALCAERSMDCPEDLFAFDRLVAEVAPTDGASQQEGAV